MSVNSFDNYNLTWRPEKEKLRQPYYRALAEDLERKIRSGELAAGTKLPPQREIADFLELNYTTITRVYDICRKKGLIYGVVGRGTFVSPQSPERISITFEPPEDCIELGAVHAFSEYSTPVERATERVMKKGYLRQLYEYDCPRGFPHQLAAGVRWLEEMGVHTDTEHCAVFSGAQNALTVAILSLFSPGDKIAVDGYTYPNFIELSKMFDISLVPISGDEKGMLPAELEAQCRKGGIKGVYLMPTCANPTGITIPPQRRRALADVMKKYGLTVLEDDIAAWIFPEEERLSFFDLLPQQTAYICGMTKSLCPGLRIAFMAYGEALQCRIENGIFNINIKTSSLDAEIITELLISGEAGEIIEHKRHLTEQACDIFEHYFPGQTVRGQYYQWLYVPNMPEDIEQQLLKRGVRVYSAARFAASDSLSREHLRVSLCSAGTVKRIEKGLSILREYIDGIA